MFEVLRKREKSFRPVQFSDKKTGQMPINLFNFHRLDEQREVIQARGRYQAKGDY